MNKKLANNIQSRFIKYCKIHTTSNRHSTNRPTTEGQWDLALLLVKELNELGIENVFLDKNCFLYAVIESNTKAKIPVFGLLAHMDTSEDASGNNVIPVIHKKYNGEILELKNGLSLNPEEYPELKRYKGETIITSDGTTLLGADDKAGIAEIMAAVEFLIKNPDIKHGKIELIFTPDEETGFGMDNFPINKIESKCCYTIDGGEDGTIEAECFNAYSMKIYIKGKVIHLGKGRGKLINAIDIAAKFINMLPPDESPRAADNRYGYFCPIEIKGNLESSEIELLIRDFNDNECKRRIKNIKTILKTLEHIYPGCKTKIKTIHQYSNMKKYLDNYPEVINKLVTAMKKTGIEPEFRIIRGGTDGSRLCEIGIPTPNVFSGGFNFHSPLEWASLSAMTRASETIINLAKAWAEG